jgi:AmmeMemoRadiSam system protein B
MRCSVEGIMYPIDAKASLFPTFSSFSGHRSDSFLAEVPHKAWALCREELDEVLLGFKGRSFPHVFVLGPLHKGPLSDDGEDVVYAPADGKLEGSDWAVKLEVPSGIRGYVTVSDDICSEEHSLEIVAPYISLLFPDAAVCHLLAPACGEKTQRIVEIIGKDFPSSLILLSNNRETCCAHMWKEALEK